MTTTTVQLSPEEARRIYQLLALMDQGEQPLVKALYEAVCTVSPDFSWCAKERQWVKPL